MMWVLFTIGAILLQTIRNLEQKNLTKKIDAITASWSRFILPFPFAIIVIGLTYQNSSAEFLKYITLNGLLQMIGNILLLKTLQGKNYSIGITLSKTETIQACLIGALFYKETISFIEIYIVFLAFIGVILMTNLNFKNRTEFLISLKNPSNIYGLLCGSCFAFTAYNLKSATIILTSQGYANLLASTIVLFYTIFIQNCFFILIKIKQGSLKKDVTKLFASENKKSFYITAIISLVGSIFWYGAYSYGKVIYVKTVGQLEIVLALLVSIFYLKERDNILNYIGIFITFLSVILLLIPKSNI